MDLAREGDAVELDLEDPQLEEKLVNELKAQGVFDQFRKDCLSDVDTKPAYQNLRVRVDKSVSSYLSKTTWRPTLNKNQLRNQLRKYIQEMSGVEAGVDRIVDQIVNPKLNTTFMPEVENVIYKYFGTSKPEEGDDMVNGNNMDDENSQNYQNGDSNHDLGGKISTRNLSTVSSDDETLNFDANSLGSSPGPGLAGNVSPLTPGGSPKVNQGDISPLTPATTPPPLPDSNTQPLNMELSQSYEEAPMQMETPPPPPPGEELKIEEIVTMEVDNEEHSRPQSAYTPPLPPTNNTNHSTPEKSYTPPLPMMIPPRPPTHQPSGPSSPHTPPLPPLPREVVGEDSGGEASMSSISDTDLGDISPPRQRKQSGKGLKKDGDSASDISEEELRLESEAGETSKNRDSDNVTPDKDTGSDEDLQQLERMKAELMAQLEGDFKLSPEESDSEGELAEGEREAVKDSPTSPDHSASSRYGTPAAKQPSPSSTNSSPNQLQKLRNLPLPSPDYSTMTPGQRIKALPLPGEMSSERFRALSGPGVPDDLTRGPSSPDTLISGPRTHPMAMSRTPSQSPSPPPRRGPQTPPSPPSAFSSSRPLPPSTPPQESLSKLDLNDPQTVTPACKPFLSEGTKSPPGPDEDLGGPGGSAPNPQAPPAGGVTSSHDESKKSSGSTGGSDQKTPVNKSSHSHSSSRSHHSSKHHSSSKDRKSDKKLDKIKEQTKAKIEKYEQKIKSKDKLKSDKFQDLDIFSTTRKPATPHLPHRTPKAGTSGSCTPVINKPQKDFEKKLAESIKKEVQRREEEKEKRRKEEEKNNSFKMPVKIDDRRRSSSDDKIKERRSSKDEKDSSKSKDRNERDKDRKSSTDKRRNSEDDRKEPREKDSKYEKEREKQAMESKKRLQEAREKKEKEEKERKRLKDKEKREKEKKGKDEEKERESRKEKEKKGVEKPRDRSKSETKDILKEKIGTLGIDNIQKMLMESLAEKTGAKFSEDEKKEMIKKLEGLIKKKKDAKHSPKKIVDTDSSEDDKPAKKVSPSKKNKIEDSSDSSSSDSDSDSDGDQRIKELKNRIRERRKSGESEKSGGQSPKRTRPVRNKTIKTIQVESEHSDTDGDFLIKEEILEKAPIKEPSKTVETPVKGKTRTVKVEPKVEIKESLTPVKVELMVEPKVESKVKVKKSSPKLQPVPKKADIDPEIENLSAFSQSDVDFMLSIKEKYDTLLQDEDTMSVSSITSEELNAAIPPTRTVEIDAGPDPEETLRIMKQFGGNPRIFTPVPEWLHPYLIGAKVKLEDVGMPTKQEISDYIQTKQTKSKKRGAGWDIVVEWVPTAPPPAKKSKLEKELGFDIDSSFGQTVAMSGGKRTRRANMKYSETEFTGEEDPTSKVGEEPNMANPVHNLEQDQPNPAPVQPSYTARTHLGSAQTPKRGGKGRKDSLVVRRVEPLKEDPMDIDTGVNTDISSEVKTVEAKDSPDSPPAAEDRSSPVITAEDNMPGIEESSPGKKRRSKDIIAAYLTSAGVERAEDKHDNVEESVSDANLVDISNESIVAVSDSSSDDKEAVVAMLDAKISAADEELNSVLRNLKRKRSTSGDSKFHGWAALTTAVPRTGFSIMLEAVGADLAQLESAGASFGMTDIDLLMSLEDEKGLLEVVMSQPVQRDIKKVESVTVPSVVGVKPIGNGVKDKDEGPKGKLSDSDSDERVLIRSS
eukprot:TRINITY_DN4706_c0_g1_i1.p1 TRINITY_DN4706_c0_g1~~TRINITY_DN4706_c0_g1_i1.p1  ORF type:complete len:1694 (-),score=649.76 TRINITY_DN4706_c0_g1_i1:268-5349(-)